MRWRTSVLTFSLLALLFIGFQTADAHVRKGTWQLQGTVSFSSSSGDLYGNETLTIFSLSPAVHYFVINKLAIGGKLDWYNRSWGNADFSALSIGPSVQYYLAGDLDAHVNPYVAAAILLQSESNGADRSGSTIQLAGGLAWFLREHLALTPELSINLESLDGDNGTTILLGMGLAGFLY